MTENEQNPASPTSPKFDINAIIANARSVITTPATYFRSMPTTGGLVEPLIFVVVMALATGVISGVLSFIGSPAGLLAFGLAAIIFIPIYATIAAFVGSAVLFGIWKIMGSERDYEASFRCFAAITAIYPVVALVSILPYLGGIVAVAWASYLLIEASVAVHGRERKTSQLVFGIIGAILIVMNVTSEYAARQLADQAEELGRALEQMEQATRQ